MDKQRFIRERKSDWQAFETIVSESRRTRKRRRPAASEFSRLFRAVCYDLSLVRSRDWSSSGGSGIGDDTDLEAYLNRLVTRGHNQFYEAPPRPWNGAWGFLAQDFPILFRARIAYFWAALSLFVVPGVITGIAIWLHPEWVRYVLPNDMLQQFETMYAEDPDHNSGASAFMAGFYIQHNIGIALQCFATGIFLGLGTARALLFNSVFFGAVTAHMINTDNHGAFFEFVTSHASFELTAIVISGGAGLLLGDSILRPGHRTRLASLLAAAQDAVRLAIGAAVLLFVAALIEAFWSPSVLPRSLKYAGGATFWFVLVAYLGFAGRKRGIVS